MEQSTSMFFHCYVDTWEMNVPAVMKFTHTNMYMKNETEQFGDTLFLHGYFIISFSRKIALNANICIPKEIT